MTWVSVPARPPVGAGLALTTSPSMYASTRLLELGPLVESANVFRGLTALEPQRSPRSVRAHRVSSSFRILPRAVGLRKLAFAIDAACRRCRRAKRNWPRLPTARWLCALPHSSPRTRPWPREAGDGWPERSGGALPTRSDPSRFAAASTPEKQP